MKIKVKLFAAHRQLLGRREVDLQVANGATIIDVWRALKDEHPQLAHLSDTLVAARNHDYAALDAMVADGDEIAFIPPVSGGLHV
jgi:molybdopterin converting factor subunit 1